MRDLRPVFSEKPAGGILELSVAQQQELVGRRRQRLETVEELSRRKMAPLSRELSRQETTVVQNARVILATMTNIYLSSLLNPERFDAVIVEEAGMSILPTLFYCAALARTRVVIVGDPQQLPPIVQSRDEYVRRAMGRNIFEVATQKSLTNETMVMLDVQYRMHPVIGDLVSKLFYEGKLRHDENTGERDEIAGKRPYPGSPLVVIDTEGQTTCATEEGGFSRLNEKTAQLCVELAVEAVRSGVDSVAIITPYVAQSRLIRQRLSRFQREAQKVERRTVHRFQGGERDVVILDTVDTAPLSPGILLADQSPTSSSSNLINVSLSRARGKLIIISDVAYFNRNSPRRYPLHYDVNKADEFERLFGHLEIGRKPSAKHNQYLILKWNFSVVDSQGEVKEIRPALHNHLNDGLKDFAKRYQDLLPYEVEFNPDDALSSLASTLSAARATPYKVYLLIDEYDNFANEVFMAGQTDSQKHYQALIQSEGMLKTVFKAIKAGTEGRGIDRMFITGVSPVVMSDLTSGFNIAKSIYLEPEFNDVCGFWENEVADVLHQIGLECQLAPEQVTEALDLMRTFYNGYSFTYEAEALIYNPTLTLYFAGHFQKRCAYPRRMLDSNLAMDRGKISYVSRLPHGEQVVTQALNETYPLTIAELADRFGVKEMLKKSHDATFMASLLYYFGVLTLTEERTDFGDLILRIPNLVIEKLYVERIAELLLPDFTSKETGQQVARIFYQTGDMQPLCDFIEQSQFSVFDNRDYKWANELTIKTTFLTLLFNDTFYIMDSETALQRDYADMTMIVRPDMRQFQLLDFLIEFKYVALGENDLSGEQVKAMSIDDLQALKPVQKALTESQTKLESYRQTLQSAYGDRLRLRTYSVIAVGFDRLVWVELETL